MKFGANTFPHRDLMQELEALASLKVDFIEFDIEPPGSTTDYILRQSNEIKEFLKLHDLFATAHAPWWVELGSPDIIMRATWLAEIKKMIDACSQIGASILAIHGNVSGLEFVTESVKKMSLETLAESFSFLKKYGDGKGVIVSLENTWQSPEEFEYILKHANGVMTTIDISHAYMQGGMPKIEEFLQRFRNSMVHLHISDNNGKSDSHEEIGKGRIPFHTVWKLIKKIDYNGTVTLEVFKDKTAVKRSLKIIKDMWL